MVATDNPNIHWISLRPANPLDTLSCKQAQNNFSPAKPMAYRHFQSKNT